MDKVSPLTLRHMRLFNSPSRHITKAKLFSVSPLRSAPQNKEESPDKLVSPLDTHKESELNKIKDPNVWLTTHTSSHDSNSLTNDIPSSRP